MSNKNIKFQIDFPFNKAILDNIIFLYIIVIILLLIKNTIKRIMLLSVGTFRKS